MMKHSLIAAMAVSGLVAPAASQVIVPKPAIVKAENLEFSKNLLAMPFTLGMLQPRVSTPVVTAGGLGYDSSNLNSYSLATSSPDAQSGRFLVGAAFFDAGSSTNATVTTMSHNGTGQTRYTIGTAALIPPGFFVVSDTSSTTSTMVFTGTGGTNGFSVYFALNGVASATYNNLYHSSIASGSARSVSITVPAKSLVFAIAMNSSNSSSTITWVGVDGITSSYLGSDATFGCAYRHYPSGGTAQTVSATFQAADRMSLGVFVLTYT